MIDRSIKKLVCYGLNKGLLTKRDEIYTVNRLMEILNVDSFDCEEEFDNINLEETLKELNENLRKAYGKVMINESMIEYNQAKTALDELVGEIETIIAASISGEDPLTCDLHPCTHNCATCGGCH